MREQIDDLKEQVKEIENLNVFCNRKVILGIIGGALAALGDVLATIGAIIQLDIDVNADFQSQIQSAEVRTVLTGQDDVASQSLDNLSSLAALFHSKGTGVVH